MKRWEIQNKFKVQSSKFKVEELITLLLENRKIKTEKEIDSFLHPKLEEVTISLVGFDKKQLHKTLTRIEKAISQKEQIIVFGDYDVDGITGTAVLWETLHGCSANVMPYIPNRVEEGYGLSSKGISNIKSQMPNVKLIITVDNGIVANEAVDFANQEGIDVIVTDHHVPSETLPKAFAIVHTTMLCGAGVAWLLSQQIKDQIAKIKYNFEDDQQLELVALATIADLVPLTGANRTLVTFGLKKLRRTRRLGIVELLKEAACDQSTLGVYEVGHIIAPRLNAAGRIENAMDSLRLLCTKDAARAQVLASKLGVTNRSRQMMTIEAALHAIGRIKNQESRIKKLLFVAHESYQEGVIGLVAGKLVEEYYRPAIVLSVGDKYAKGSARSVSGFNMIDFLREHITHFVNVGGHPMAAGFTVETKNLPMLQKILEDFAEGMLDDVLLTRKIKIDCELRFSEITKSTYLSLQRLAPFGMGNPEPVFMTSKVTVDDSRIIGRDGKHLKLRLSQGDKHFEAIAFGMSEFAAKIKDEKIVDVAYTIDNNVWNGTEKLQLKIKDIKVE
ncbi:MAG: single-stranded-DNA-specific exonuclease RecJ [Candidatus Levybacteria bacterium]|nr:single-stranded-DNA-specific exonuclease RecJ [Candidatus Levybacteria bacterium]